MKWPRKIRVNGKTFKVRLLAKPHLGKGAIGGLWVDEGEIRIWRGLSQKDRWITLLHEIMHLAWSTSVGNAFEKFEESLMVRLDTSLYEILNRNFGFGDESDPT